VNTPDTQIFGIQLSEKTVTEQYRRQAAATDEEAHSIAAFAA